MACSRDCKKFGLSALAAFIVFNLLDFLLHEKLLSAVYHKPAYATLWNPDAVMKSRMWAMFLAHAIASVVLAKGYALGYEDEKAPLGQGLRYGLFTGLLVSPLGSLMQFFVYPVSLKLAAAWIVGGLVQFVVLGVVIASIYRPAPETAHAH
jgi:hypothetical protein